MVPLVLLCAAGIVGRPVGIGNRVEYFVGRGEGASQVCRPSSSGPRIASCIHAQHLQFVSRRGKHLWDGKNRIYRHSLLYL